MQSGDHKTEKHQNGNPDTGRTDHTQNSDRIIREHRPDHALQENPAVAENTELRTTDTLAVGNRHFADIDPFMQSTCAHHRSQIQSIRQRVNLLEDLTFKDPHSTGTVCHLLATQYR